MADKFRVGQKVRIVNSPSAERIGLIANIKSQRRWIDHAVFGYIFCYTLDIPTITPNANFCGYPEECLEPLYDGDEPSSWSECAWKPHLIDNKLPEMWKEKS